MIPPAIKQFIKKKKWERICLELTRLHASEAADFLMHMDPSIQVIVFRSLPRKFAAKLFAYMDPADKDDLLKALTTKETQKLLTYLKPDDRTDLLEEMPAAVTRRLFKLLSPEDLREARRLLGYPVDSVGREMTPDYLDVQSNWTVKKALEHIRENGKEKETVNIVYITDKKGKLIGDVQLKYLIFADPKSKVGDIAKKSMDAPALSAFDDQEKAVELIKKLNVVALPIVDSEGVLLGIVTIDDLIDIEEEEVTEDFQKMGAVAVGEGGDLSLTNLVDASVKLLYKKRILWLMILVGMNIFSGAAIALFEKVIAQAVVLVFFLPLLIGSGGNAGSQAAMLMVRALGTGDVKMSDWFRLLGKEFLVAGFLGITMALGVSIIGWFRGGIQIVVIVATSMLIIVMAGSLIGMTLPFIFTKLKKDPATASGPLVTSIADICGVVVYFSIAKWYLGL
ncbi:magnesium transporter [Candidatus Peregrinibacteria bacterium]|nr:magnesium transporter [Candidatus Peregrinibacteria bacterium]